MIFHLGTNDGTVPFCYASVVETFQGYPPVGPCRSGPLLEPDTWCPKCLKVWDRVHGRPYPFVTPLKRCPLVGPTCSGEGDQRCSLDPYV